MARPKKSSNAAKAGKKSEPTESKNESKSVIQENEFEQNETLLATTAKEQTLNGEDAETTIRILFHGSCPKLSSRGVGNLEYEIGFDSNDEAYLRIAGNASSGAFSNKWIPLNEIRSIHEKVEDQSFRAIVLNDLYSNQSSNNHGYLGAVLKAEGVVVTLPKQPTVLQLGEWQSLLGRIDSWKKKEISLPDHIAKAAKKRQAKPNKQNMDSTHLQSI